MKILNSSYVTPGRRVPLFLLVFRLNAGISAEFAESADARNEVKERKNGNAALVATWKFSSARAHKISFGNSRVPDSIRFLVRGTVIMFIYFIRFFFLLLVSARVRGGIHADSLVRPFEGKRPLATIDRLCAS